jgi:lysophospholipase L1-like esterase
MNLAIHDLVQQFVDPRSGTQATVLDGLDLERDPKVRVLDIWGDMVAADGTLAKDLFTPDNIHLTQEGGYRLYAEKLQPILEALLAGPARPSRPPRAP